jgi:hypothetical protein
MRIRTHMPAHMQAALSALQAHKLRPDWPKPLHRLAHAQLGAGRFEAAIAACMAGESLVAASSEGLTEFSSLWDEAAVAAALQGNLAGYSGTQLEVEMRVSVCVRVGGMLTC